VFWLVAMTHLYNGISRWYGRIALRGRRSVKAPSGWKSVYRKLSMSKDAEVRDRWRQLSLLFGSIEALADLKAKASDAKAASDDRVHSPCRRCSTAGDAESFSLVRSLLDDPVLARPALRGLARPATKKRFPNSSFPAIPNYPPTLARTLSALWLGVPHTPWHFSMPLKPELSSYRRFRFLGTTNHCSERPSRQ
jgi:hypothetical protein